MPQLRNSPIAPVIVGAIGALLGAVIGAGATLKSQSLQSQREMASQCIASNAKREETLRQKAELYVAAPSEQIAFFQKNNSFGVRDAREKLADVQKTAFVLSIYAGQDLSSKSIAIVRSMEAVFMATSEADRASALKKLYDSVAAWHPSFRAELSAIWDERATCKSEM